MPRCGGPGNRGGEGRGAGPSATHADVRCASLDELLRMSGKPSMSDQVGPELLRRLSIPSMRWTHDIRYDPHFLDGVAEGTRAVLELLYRDSVAVDSQDIRRLDAMSTGGIIARLAGEGVEGRLSDLRGKRDALGT